MEVVAVEVVPYQVVGEEVEAFRNLVEEGVEESQIQAEVVVFPFQEEEAEYYPYLEVVEEYFHSREGQGEPFQEVEEGSLTLEEVEVILLEAELLVLEAYLHCLPELNHSLLTNQSYHSSKARLH